MTTWDISGSGHVFLSLTVLFFFWRIYCSELSTYFAGSILLNFLNDDSVLLILFNLLFNMNEIGKYSCLSCHFVVAKALQSYEMSLYHPSNLKYSPFFNCLPSQPGKLASDVLGMTDKPQTWQWPSDHSGDFTQDFKREILPAVLKSSCACKWSADFLKWSFCVSLCWGIRAWISH